MGKRGPMPKPADQRLGHAHKAQKAMRLKAPLTVLPNPLPDWTPDTQEAWRTYWASELSRLALAVDLPSIRRLFAMYDQHALSMNLVNSALLVKGSTGQLRANPLADHALKLEGAILRLENELGLTPMARSRLGVKLTAEVVTAAPTRARKSPYSHLKVVGE